MYQSCRQKDVHGLESVKKRYKGSQTMGGKGKLTEDLMRRFQSLYSKSIRDYCNGVRDGSRVADLSDLQRDIKAGLHHTISSDGYPDHDFCPTGPETWCQYNQHVLRDTLEDYSKPVPLLPRWIRETLIPLFDRHSDLSLLERCQLAATQNINESFNQLIWKRCPKVYWCSGQSVFIGTMLATIKFNQGAAGLFPLISGELGAEQRKIAEKTDSRRIYCAKPEKQARKIKRRYEKKGKKSATKDYNPGGHW